METKNAKERSIRRQIEDLDDNDVTTISTNQDVEFGWDDEENNLRFEVINIDKVTLSKEQIETILAGGSSETMNWEGTVIRKFQYDGPDEGEECSEAAYGGEGNTDGISESGALYVDRDLLVS